MKGGWRGAAESRKFPEIRSYNFALTQKLQLLTENLRSSMFNHVLHGNNVTFIAT
jgi:hypothetical protein